MATSDGGKFAQEERTNGPYGDAFTNICNWLVESGACRPGDLAHKLGITGKSYLRYRAGGAIQKGKWDGIRGKLVHLRAPTAMIDAIDRLVSSKRHEVNRPDTTSQVGRPYAIVPRNKLPKLCYLAIDVPSQGSSAVDFMVIGELRFARMLDKVDSIPVSIGLKRVSLSTSETSCTRKIGSLIRPRQLSAVSDAGAANSIITADAGTVLIGDKIDGATVASFVATHNADGNLPKVSIIIELLSENDLEVRLEKALPKRSKSQLQLAQRWIERQLAASTQNEDGSYEISRVDLTWREQQ